MRHDKDRVIPQLATSRPETIAVGVLLSLVLHAGLLTSFHGPRGAADHALPAPSMIWIAPAKPREAIVLEAPSVRRNIARQRPMAEIRVPRLPRASTNEPIAAARPENIPIPPVALPENAGPAAPPRFDRNAALKTAREFAVARSGKSDPAIAQLQDKPINEPRTEAPLARAIGGATRPDCKTMASSSGIFALVIVPYMALKDKKDSGCKW